MPRVKQIAEKEIENGIYRKIKGAMGLNGISQQDIAILLGLHKSTVSQHFKHQTFSLEQLIYIFQYVGLRMEFTICEK